MANKDAPFGMRPIRMVSGEPFSGGSNRYRITANYDTNIFMGDIVEVATAGTITRVAASNTDPVLGVFLGCFYSDPTTSKPTYSNYYPADTNASDIIANVVDDPNVMFEMQADAAFPVADLFGNFDIVDNSPVGDTNSGWSRMELDVTTGATTSNLPIKAMDISQDPANSDVAAANTNVVVVFNNQLYSGGTAGLAQ